MKLTYAKLKSIKPKPKAYRLYEGEGFGVKVQSSGSVSFIYHFTSPETGGRRYMTISKFAEAATDGEVGSLKHARAEAGSARDLVANGIDPIEERSREGAVAAAESELTLTAMLGWYITSLESRGASSAPQAKGLLTNHLAGFEWQGETLGNRKASDITPEHITRALAKAAKKTPVAANRVRSYAKAAFKFALTAHAMPEWADVVPNFGLVYNPADATMAVKGAEKSGERALSWEEVQRFWTEAGTVAISPDLAIAAKLLLSTGQRPAEVLGAKWEEFHSRQKLWVIPWRRRKTAWRGTDVDHVVPMTETHLELLKALRAYYKEVGVISDYLFPAGGEGCRTASALGQAIERYCEPQGRSKRAPFERFTPRDLRRTWKTRAAEIGLGLEIRNRLQGHALTDVGSRNYDKFDYLSDKRKAMLTFTKALEREVSRKARRKPVSRIG